MEGLTLYLMIGYPGAGKTTVSKLIAEKTGAVHLWADHERHKMFGKPTHSHEENLKLYGVLNHQADKLLGEGRSVIFDTNFNYYEDRQHLREIAANHGAETRVIWVTTPKETAKKRAVHESHGQHTRLYGNMPETDFERIAGQMETPTESEKVIKISGIKIDPEEVMRLLIR